MVDQRVEYLLLNREFVRARKLLRRYLLKDRTNTKVMYSLSISEAELGNTEEALDLLSRIIAIDPSHALAHYTKASLLSRLNNHLDALIHHDHAVRLKGSSAWVFVNRGSSRAAVRNFIGAIDDFDRAIELDPTLAAAYENKGSALLEMRLFQEALRFFAKTIELDPFNINAISGRSLCLVRFNRLTEALIVSDELVVSHPEHPKTWSNRGFVLNALKRYDDALVSYKKSIELKPDYAEAWGNRGIALNNLKFYEEALVHFDKSIELKPEYAYAWNNRGIALNSLKRHEEALVSFDRATQLQPEFADALYNKGLIQLAHKNFSEGFKNYRYRWRLDHFSSSHIRTELSQCGQKSSKQNLLLWAEQGLGDEIFFSGMLPQALKKFSNIGLIADSRLHSIFGRSFPKITLLHPGDTNSAAIIGAFDSQSPIGDLGYMLALSEEEIKSSRKPFLISDPLKKSAFRSCAPFSNKKLVCGLAWASSNKESGREKSIALSQLEPILKDPRLNFINLQYGNVDLTIQNLKNQLNVDIHQIYGLDIYNDLDGLLALIEACDIVITTSNVTAHLAGSIGKMGCVLVPFSKGKIWYWHMNDTFSYWYPSLRVFYQDNEADWSETISRAHKWLQEVI